MISKDILNLLKNYYLEFEISEEIWTKLEKKLSQIRPINNLQTFFTALNRELVAFPENDKRRLNILFLLQIFLEKSANNPYIAPLENLSSGFGNTLIERQFISAEFFLAIVYNCFFAQEESTKTQYRRYYLHLVNKEFVSIVSQFPFQKKFEAFQQLDSCFGYNEELYLNLLHSINESKLTLNNFFITGDQLFDTLCSNQTLSFFPNKDLLITYLKNESTNWILAPHIIFYCSTHNITLQFLFNKIDKIGSKETCQELLNQIKFESEKSSPQQEKLWN
jgi:hypothetical protein